METVSSFTGVLPFVIEICIPIITLLIAWGVRKLVMKLKMEDKINTEILIDIATERSIQYIEQWSTNFENIHDEKVESGDKLAKAVDCVREELKRLGLKDLAEGMIITRIEAIINAGVVQ